MNAKSLKALYEKVCYSKNPADIFDCLKTPKEKDALLSELKTEWRELIIKCHPDKFVKEGPDKFKICENYLLPSSTELRSSSYIESSKDFHVKIQITTPKYIEVAKSDFIDFFENTFGIKVIAVSNGPTAKDKSWRNDV